MEFKNEQISHVANQFLRWKVPENFRLMAESVAVLTKIAAVFKPFGSRSKL